MGLRESEIKHSRIAMFGFVGYIVHANGIHWPTKGPWDNIPTDISPQEMWDLTPEAAKWQIILTIAFLEFWRENAYFPTPVQPVRPVQDQQEQDAGAEGQGPDHRDQQ